MVAQNMRAWGNAGETAAQLRPKRWIALINTGLLLVDGVLALLKAPAWSCNLIEWLLSFTVIAFHITFAYDLKGARVALLPAPTTAPATKRAEPLLLGSRGGA
jgi:hypothetical protein